MGDEVACECVAYTIRTDYGTGVEHDVDRSSCPIHGGEPAEVGASETCPRCGGAWVPYWFTYGGEMDVCEDPGCSGWRPRPLITASTPPAAPVPESDQGGGE